MVPAVPNARLAIKPIVRQIDMMRFVELVNRISALLALNHQSRTNI